MPPYRDNISEQFGAGAQTAGTSWRLFIFLLVIFGVAVASYVGLRFGYRTFLNNSIADLSSQIQLQSSKLQFRDQQDLLDFYSQIANLKGLLGSHVFGSKIFEFLETNTNLRVSFTSVTLAVPEREVVIDGLAASYENLVQQLTHWQQAEGVERLALEENSTVNDMVRFRARITFDKAFFGSANAVASPATPPAAPATTSPTAPVTQ